MLTRFICWLVGHKLWERKFTEVPTGQVNPLTGQPGLFYTGWVRLPFCTRCGHEPPKEGA